MYKNHKAYNHSGRKWTGNETIMIVINITFITVTVVVIIIVIFSATVVVRLVAAIIIIVVLAPSSLYPSFCLPGLDLHMYKTKILEENGNIVPIIPIQEKQVLSVITINNIQVQRVTSFININDHGC